MNWSGKTGKALLALGLGTLFLAMQTNAQTTSTTTNPAPKVEQEDPAEAGWHMDFTPYIWFAGLHGTTGALGHDASVHASFGDIFNYLNLGAMGTFEVRNGRVLMPVDFLWMKLSDNKALPLNDAEAESVDTTMRETILTPKIGYRIGDGKRVKVDALFGARIWHISTDLKLQPRELETGFSQATTWADAVAGGRITFLLSPKASVTVFGDAGGASARSDWQAGGVLGYQVSRRWNLLFGYRYLSVNYRPNTNAQFVYDVNMPGLALGATFKIK